MNLGIVVDGAGESQALKLLLNRIDRDVVQLLNPLYADIQPYAPPKQIARVAGNSVQILKNRHADKIIVLVDLENQSVCPGVHATNISNALEHMGHPNIRVVVKVKCFENWLAAAPDSINGLPGFTLKRNQRDQVAPGRADQLEDALSWLSRAKDPASARFHKTIDANRVCASLSLEEMAQNSRSFSKFFSQI